MARLILTLLGGFRARLEPATPLALPTRKAKALLAYLALSPASAQPRDKLASLLWGSTLDTTARTSLRQTLYALRKCLREAGPRLLAVDGESVSLDPNSVTIDVRDFERRAAEGTPSALAEAATLYQGEFLDGLTVQEPPFDDWLLGHRERLREVALTSLGGLLAHQRAIGSIDSAVQTALRLLELDALQEPVHRALMQLYVEIGRRGSALRQYQLCVATLQRELRTEPEAETKALYHEILSGRAHVTPDRESPPIQVALAQPLSHQTAFTEPPPAWEAPLAGRQRDIGRLREALEVALGGRGRLVVLVGEAGAGKSRLVSELTALATRRLARVLVGRCYETERILPFAPWVHALRSGRVVAEREVFDTLEVGWRDELERLLPELSGETKPATASAGAELGARSGGDPRYPFEAITELLKRLARRQPLLVVLEDAHWADEMSVRFLAFLGRRAHEMPLLLVVTVREEELGDVGLLRQSLNELDDNGELMLPVSPLSRADTVALVQALAPPGLPEQLVAQLAQDAWRISDGNAFVIVEVMHALREGQTISLARRLPLPAKVRTLVLQRLQRLSDRGRRLVAAAAVIGRQFDFALVQRAADMSEREAAESVEELVRHRVLRGAGDGLEFTHDYIREVATGELPPPLRMALHRRVAESLEDVYAHALGAHALALGTHYRNGEAWEKAAAFLQMAGRQAAARSAHHEAVACFEEALNALRRLPASPEADDRDLDVRIELRQSLYPMGRFADLARHLREAERIAEKLDDRPRLARVAAYISNHAWITGDLSQALAFGERALSLAEASGSAGLAVEANFRLGQVHWSLGRYRDAVRFFECCGTVAEPQGVAARYGPSGWPTELGLAELSLYYLAAPLTELGRYDEALAAARRALDFATRIDRPFALAGAYAAIGRAHLYQGRFGEAAAALTRGLEVCRRWEFSVHRPWLAAALGHTYALAGRVSKGLSILSRAVDEAERVGNVGGHAWRLASLGEALLLAGRADEAAKRADQSLAQSRARGERGHEAWALRLQAEVAASRKLRDVACERFDEAIALARALEMRPLEARCHLGLAPVHQGEGRTEDARMARSRAIEMFQSLGSEFWLTQAQRLTS